MQSRNLPRALSSQRLIAALAAVLFTTGAAIAADQAQQNAVEQSKAAISTPPWSAGDQVGMANTVGPGTWARCAYHLAAAGAKYYELSHVRSNTMPMSPFGAPLAYESTPSISLPGTRHVFNGEKVLGGEPGAQGTQMDALGHFAYYEDVPDLMGQS